MRWSSSASSLATARGIEEADPLEDAAAEGAEPHGVDEAVLARRVVLGAARTERALEGGGDAPLEERPRLDARRAPGVVRAALVEGLDASADEVRRVLARARPCGR